MIRSYLLEVAAKRLTPLLLILSLWVFYRGHNEPGGGFIGGLLAAGAIGLYAMGCGPAAARAYLRVPPERLAGVGVLTAALAGLLAWSADKPFLSGLWTKLPLGFTSIKLGTPLLFDLGVYLTVIGVTVSFFLNLEEE